MAITLKDLLEAGVHFGHQTKRWNPKMKPYIFGSRNGIHIFDLKHTAKGLNDACRFLYQTAAEGGEILFVGTKRQAQDIVRDAAEENNNHFITHRWMGGTLTNLQTIRKSVAKMDKFEKMESDGTLESMKKKQASQIRRELGKLQNSIGGIKTMKEAPAAIVIIDTVKEHLAVKEANTLGIPVVAILDTNSNPDQVAHGVPGNDDAVKSLEIIIAQFAAAVKKGKGIADKKAADAKKEAAAKKAAAEKGDEEAAKKAPAKKAPAKKAPAKKTEETAAKKAPAKKAPAKKAPAKKTEEAAEKKAPAKKAPAKKAAAKKTEEAPATKESAE